MERLFFSLMVDLTSDAPEGPGWYIRAFADGQPLMDAVGVSSEAAYTATRALQEALQSTEGELPEIALPQLAESGSKLIREALEKALKRAEEEAAKIKTLRRKLSNIPTLPEVNKDA